MKPKNLSRRLAALPSRVAIGNFAIARAAPKKADNFYLSPEWRSLMAQIIKERGRRCESCGRTGTRIFGDHIVEIKDGGQELDKRNVKCLCGSCHSKKTAKARQQRMNEYPLPTQERTENGQHRERG